MSFPAEPSVITASKQRFARNIRWQFIANGSQALLGGAYLIVLGRSLGPTGFGVFSAVTALVSVAGLLLEMRLQEVVARDFCHLDDDAASAAPRALHLVDLFALETLSRLLPALALLLLSGVLAQSINLPPGSTGLLALGAAGFVLAKSGNSVSNGLLRVLSRTDLIAACMAADWGLRLMLTAAAALAWRLDVLVALWIALLAGLLSNGVQVWIASRAFGEQVAPLGLAGWSVGGALVRLRGARRLIASNLGISASDLMAKDLDVALISGLLTADKVGLYKMAKSFVQVLWRAIDPFYIAIMPEVQKLWQRGETATISALLRKTSVRLLLLSTVLVVVANAIVTILGDRVLSADYHMVPMLMLAMSPWVLVCAPLIWGPALAVAINRPELSVGGSLLGLVIGLAAFATLTPAIGLIGAAIAWNATLVSGFLFTTITAVLFAAPRLTPQQTRGDPDENKPIT